MLNLFYRKKREGANSIETVFGAIEKELPEHRIIKMPMEGGSPLKITRNILYARKNRSEINHITGDCHYIAIGTGRNTVLTIHDVGSAFQGSWIKRKFVKWLWFTIPCRIAKKISVISEATKNDLIKICPWAENKISVIPNPIDTRFVFTPAETEFKIPKILHLGTKTNKNLERTLYALSRIECELTIIGKMSDAQIELAKKLGILYHNRYDILIEELILEYQRCDIVSFPSFFEGFGMPIIEAQAIGRPILAGDIPVLRDVAGEEGALFVDPYNERLISYGFRRLIFDIELRESLVKAGQENVKRFSPEKIAAMYTQLSQQL